jgi:hypothetical protein
MEWDDYLRQQAATYRQLAEKAEDAVVKKELLDLADVCEEVGHIEGQAAQRLGFRTFQFAPRTCWPLCGRLSCRKTEHAGRSAG